jgi:hypothetical protein
VVALRTTGSRICRAPCCRRSSPIPIVVPSPTTPPRSWPGRTTRPASC